MLYLHAPLLSSQVECLQNTLEEIKTKEHPETPVDDAVLTVYDILPYITQQQKTDAQHKCQVVIHTFKRDQDKKKTRNMILTYLFFIHCL